MILSRHPSQDTECVTVVIDTHWQVKIDITAILAPGILVILKIASPKTNQKSWPIGQKAPLYELAVLIHIVTKACKKKREEISALLRGVSARYGHYYSVHPACERSFLFEQFDMKLAEAQIAAYTWSPVMTFSIMNDHTFQICKSPDQTSGYT